MSNTIRCSHCPDDKGTESDGKIYVHGAGGVGCSHCPDDKGTERTVKFGRGAQTVHDAAIAPTTRGLKGYFGRSVFFAE